MAEWVELNNIDVLTSPITKDIDNNFNYLQEQAELKEKIPVVIYDCYMPYNTRVDEIMQKFNLVEANMQNIHEILKYSDPYFREWEWLNNEPLGNKLHTGVNRWINWLNDIKKYFDGGILYFLTDNQNRYIIDNENRYILIYKRWENA